MDKKIIILITFLLLLGLRTLLRRIASGFLNNPLSRTTFLTRCIKLKASAMRRKGRAFATPDNAIS